MSAILFASVVRVRDGLPLSASTDHDQNASVHESKKYAKVISKKLERLPDRCSLRRGPHNINFISSLGVGYVMLCSESYPNVLAFCFLDELQKEFITTYETAQINNAVRPYSFIEFDNFIQKTKQRFNNPRSLSTKKNLADMQTEIRLRPPYQVSLHELGVENGLGQKTLTYKGIAPHQRLEPLTLPGIISALLSILCAGLNLIRGFHAIESLLQNDDDLSCIIAFFLGSAACVYQCYLFACITSWRNAKSFLAFGLICLCNMYLHELRSLWQLFFHVTVGAFTTLQIRLRQPQNKSPDYNV
ncbi:vesicle-trafficking protein SEC22a [Spea bombifrons]|uniref:vesicle-trafficking protein SEC22a n=1 Tax=Spea bombifrons TaxID=233779 RepID=UPI00234B3F46|nr:vesicle-trafficking protein SEC22a [Spea bombifrons]